jgi:hypothetical protein
LDLGEVLEFWYGFFGGPKKGIFCQELGKEERWWSVVCDCSASWVLFFVVVQKGVERIAELLSKSDEPEIRYQGVFWEDVIFSFHTFEEAKRTPERECSTCLGEESIWHSWLNWIRVKSIWSSLLNRT